MTVKDFYTKENPLVVYKWTFDKGQAPWGNGNWDLPKNGKSGKARGIGNKSPIMCAQGIHGYPDLVSTLRGRSGTRLFVAQLWGKVVYWEYEKAAAQHGRLCYELYLNSAPLLVRDSFGALGSWLVRDSWNKITRDYWADRRSYGTIDKQRELCDELHARLMKIQKNPDPTERAMRLNHP